MFRQTTKANDEGVCVGSSVIPRIPDRPAESCRNLPENQLVPTTSLATQALTARQKPGSKIQKVKECWT